MTGDQFNLASLLGSRICHDLISPLGAISNGVELLNMSGAASMPEIELIAQSIENANARIAFFRIAFGAAEDVQVLTQGEVRRVLDDLSRGSRLSFGWEAGGPHPRAEVKLVFLALNCLETAMPRGGLISVTCADGAWCLEARGERLRRDPALWNHLARPGTAFGARAAEVQFLMAPLVAADLGRELSVELQEDSAVMRF
jgi:histidine phosphotransferase ChpT